MGASHLSIFEFGENLVPRVVVAASEDGGDLAARAGSEFVRLALYRGDPLTSIIDRGSRAHGPVVQISTPVASAERDRHHFYEMLGLADRITILDRSRAGWISLNFYRVVGSRELSDAALADLISDAAALHALASRHLELFSGERVDDDMSELLRRRLMRLGGSLTARETEVCILALQGATNPEIASSLKIEPSTVSTLRHRAYDRLGVSNIVEIFLKCLVIPA